jgi:hypothetical protein
MHATFAEMRPGTELEDFHGRQVEWGGLKVSFEQAAAGFDTSPYFEEDPGGSCAKSHWRYLLKGKLLVRYADHEETINEGEVYYLAPGHNVRALERTEMVEFTPLSG